MKSIVTTGLKVSESCIWLDFCQY